MEYMTTIFDVMNEKGGIIILAIVSYRQKLEERLLLGMPCEWNIELHILGVSKVQFFANLWLLALALRTVPLKGALIEC